MDWHWPGRVRSARGSSKQWQLAGFGLVLLALLRLLRGMIWWRGGQVEQGKLLFLLTFTPVGQGH